MISLLSIGIRYKGSPQPSRHSPHPSVYVPYFPCAFPPRPLLLRFRSRKVVDPTTAPACLHVQPSTAPPLPLPCPCPFTRALQLFGVFLAQSLSKYPNQALYKDASECWDGRVHPQRPRVQKIKTIPQSISIDNPQTPPGIQQHPHKRRLRPAH